MSADMGVQLESSKGELLGLTYDRKDDALEVEIPGLVHWIYHPLEIYAVEADDGSVTSFKIVVEKLDLRRIRRVRATPQRGRAAGRSQEGLLK